MKHIYHVQIEGPERERGQEFYSRGFVCKYSVSPQMTCLVEAQRKSPFVTCVIVMYIISSIYKTGYVCLSVTILRSYTIRQFAFDCDQTLQQGASW